MPSGLLAAVVAQSKMPFDPDGDAFVTAAGLTDETQIAAINQLVIDLKRDNLWDKMTAVYPLVGGTAATHKWNLKDPRDLDAAYRVTFYGGVQHSVNGIQFNGTTGDTKIRSDAFFDNYHMAYYSRTPGRLNTTDIDAGNYSNAYLLVSYNNTLFTKMYCTEVNRGATPYPDSDGLLMNRRLVNELKFSRNGVPIANYVAGSPIGGNASTHYFGGSNNGAFRSYKQCAFFSMGESMSDSESSDFYDAVQSFQTTLGRQV